MRQLARSFPTPENFDMARKNTGRTATILATRDTTKLRNGELEDTRGLHHKWHLIDVLSLDADLVPFSRALPHIRSSSLTTSCHTQPPCGTWIRVRPAFAILTRPRVDGITRPLVKDRNASYAGYRWAGTQPSSSSKSEAGR